jgi:hypothetical protein
LAPFDYFVAAFTPFDIGEKEKMGERTIDVREREEKR